MNLQEDKTNMYDYDIKTSVQLFNTTVHNINTDGEAGKVAYIGSFPSMNNDVYECTSLKELRDHYGIEKGTWKETEFEGGRDGRRLFMEGFSGYRGVSSLITVNTCEVDNPVSNKNLNLNALSESSFTVETVDGESDASEDRKVQDAMIMTWDRLKKALSKIADDDFDMLFIGNDLHEAATDGHSIIDVYTLILNFLNNNFATKRPAYLIGAVKTNDVQDQPSGLGSKEINVNGNETANPPRYGAKQICDVFRRNAKGQLEKIDEPGKKIDSNELAVGALFYNGGTILGEEVGPGEFAAHMCGWIATLPVNQDLTYLTIPGVTDISEELYLGVNDAGAILNKMGINILKPKSRKDHTYYVNNSITPNGWHLNHVRAVSYLLKRYAFEGGLGINNLVTQLEKFKANINSITNDVMDKIDIITDVTFEDEITVIDPYHIALAMNVELAGVVTRIDIGVSMNLQNYN